jgi:hypothetical protein
MFGGPILLLNNITRSIDPESNFPVPTCPRKKAIHIVIGEFKNIGTEGTSSGFGNLKFLSVTMLVAIFMKQSLETFQSSSDFLALRAALKISFISGIHKLGSTEILWS